MHSILIVDDDQKIRAVLSEIPPDQGIFNNPGGRQALELVREAAPEVILLDLKMPGIDGMETLAELRSEICRTFLQPLPPAANRAHDIP